MTHVVQTIRDPLIVSLATEMADGLESLHGKASRTDSSYFLNGAAIADTASPEWKIFQDIDRLRALADQANGGRARPFFMIARALQMIDVVIAPPAAQ